MCSKLEAAGLTKVGQVMDANVNFILEYLLRKLSEMRMKYRKQQIVKIAGKLEKCLLPD